MWDLEYPDIYHHIIFLYYNVINIIYVHMICTYDMYLMYYRTLKTHTQLNVQYGKYEGEKMK